MSNPFYVDSSEANGTIFTNDQQSAVSVTFTASGTWKTASGSKYDYGPEGKVGTKSKKAQYPNNTLYALLAVNGNNEVVGEGASISLSLEANESVRFVVNDTHYPNNSGQLTVDWQANAVAPQQAQSNATFKIHPAIGIPRLGNSDDYYIAPETASGLPIKAGTEADPITVDDLRDNEGGLKRQAARFRVYQDDGQTEVTIGTPLNGSTVTQIEWTVRLANKKASWYEFLTLRGSDNRHEGSVEEGDEHIYHPLRNMSVDTVDKRRGLIINPGARTVSGANATEQHFSRQSAPDGFPPQKDGDFPNYFGNQIDTLGSILTDEQGRLLVLGGHGNACSPSGNTITSYANNDDWFDDVSDGPVTAKIHLENGEEIEVEGAWVLVGSPAYAPELFNFITLYDTILDTGVREMNYRPDIHDGTDFKRGPQGYFPHYDTEIEPIFDRLVKYKWVADIYEHDFVNHDLGDPNTNASVRKHVFDKLRDPETPNSYNSSGNMPDMAGDSALGYLRTYGFPESRFLTLTRTQYFMLEQWANSYFIATCEPLPSEREESLAQRLDRFALEGCVGGAFGPGIEMTWISREKQIYKTPFDFRIKSNGNLANNELFVPMPGDADEHWDTGLEAGDITKYMALPWQADFFFCTIQPLDKKERPTPPPSGGRKNLYWWPPQRPVEVYKSGDQEKPVGWYAGSPEGMVNEWKDLGFIWKNEEAGPDDNEYIEVERNLGPNPTLEKMRNVIRRYRR